MADLLKGTHNTEETTISNDIDELFPKCRVKPAKSQDRYRNNNGPMFIRSNGSAVDLLMSPNNNTSVLPCYSESQDRRIMFQEGDEDLLGLDSPSSRKDSFSESGGSGGSCAEDLRKPEAKWVEAGAKEVFSQSRARAGRKRSGDDWGKKIKRVDAETTCRPVKVYKETVFASEIQTLENTYRPCADPDVTVLDSGKTRSYQSSPEENRTFDEIGEYPRSRLDTLSGSTVKNLAESLLMMSPASTQIGDPDAGNTSDDSMPSSTMPYACLSTVTDAGRPALPNWNSSGSPETNSPTSSPVACVIGSVPIAKYEGSPRRLGARHRASPAIPGFGNYLPKPGHPQRILAQVDVLGGLDQNTAEKGELKDTKIDTTLTPVKDEMELGRESLSAIIPELGQVLKPKEDAPFAHQPSPESVYEFSETRKVLEEFFGGAHPSIMSLSKDEQKASRAGSNAGRRSQRDSDEAIKTSSNNETRNQARSSVRRVKMNNNGYAMNLIIRPNTSSPSSSLSVDQETLSTEDFGETEIGIRVEESRNFTLSPETTECEDPSDLESFVCEDPEQPDSEEGSRVSSVEGSGKAESTKSGAVGVMPVLEDGLSSGDEGRPDEPDLINAGDDFCVSKMNGDRMVEEFLRGNTSSGGLLGLAGRIQAEPQSSPTRAAIQREMRALEHELQARARARARALRKHRRASPKSDLDQPTMDYRDSVSTPEEAVDHLSRSIYSPDRFAGSQNGEERKPMIDLDPLGEGESGRGIDSAAPVKGNLNEYESIAAPAPLPPPPPPAPFPHRLATSSPSSLASSASLSSSSSSSRCLGSLRAIEAKNGTETHSESESGGRDVRRTKSLPPDSFDVEPRDPGATSISPGSSHGTVNIPDQRDLSTPVWVPRGNGPDKPTSEAVPLLNETNVDEDDLDTDQETDRLLGQHRSDDGGFFRDEKDKEPGAGKKKGKSKEGIRRHEPSVLIEGVLFRARYLGSTQLVCEGQPTKATRMIQAEEAVSRIKAPEGESQPSTEVDLFISTEKIMVLNTDLKEIMMDHALRSISYIADIGDLVVLMARRRITQGGENGEAVGPTIAKTPKMICHIFESEEAQFIAQSIGQAFHVAYVEFLKANGIEADQTLMKDMDYQEVLNSQEIFGDELQMFAKKENQKEVVVPKSKGEILGMVIVESGWGSMLPTVVVANLLPSGPAARCGLLNIGDQIIAINGVSLVGLPLSTCQQYIKNTKTQTVVKLTVVPCPPVVEVKIRRPDTKYQLGFSVQNGVICSLLRGGIAERGGVRVGHRIIEINNQSVVAVPHEKIVNLLATSTGEIAMKTMPTSMFRLLTGQETPVYM